MINIKKKFKIKSLHSKDDQMIKLFPNLELKMN